MDDHPLTRNQSVPPAKWHGRLAQIRALWIISEHLLWALGVVQLPLSNHMLQQGNAWPLRHRINAALAFLDAGCVILVATMVFFSLDSPVRTQMIAIALIAAAVVFLTRGGSVLLTALWLTTIGRHLRFRLLLLQIKILMIAFLTINAIWAYCSLFYVSEEHPRHTDFPLIVATITAAPTLLIFAPWSALVLTRFARRIQKRPTSLHAFPVITSSTL